MLLEYSEPTPQGEVLRVKSNPVNEPNIAAEKKMSFADCFKYKQTWAFAFGKFMTDGVWWFHLFWLPSFLKGGYGLSQTEIAIPVAVVYVIAGFGSVFGGWLPLHFIRKGWPVFRARKTSMLIYAFCALPVVTAQLFGNTAMWYAIFIIGFAAAAHQAWSANIFTTVSDMFPKKAVGSVTGIGGMAGGLGGMVVAKIAGWLFDYYKAEGNIVTGYMIMFVACGFAYLLSWIIMHLLVPTMKTVKL